jgi:hypothetical protein
MSLSSADREPDKPDERAEDGVEAPPLCLVARRIRSRPVVVGDLRQATGATVAKQNISREARGMTDGAGHDHNRREVLPSIGLLITASRLPVALLAAENHGTTPMPLREGFCL